MIMNHDSIPLIRIVKKGFRGDLRWLDLSILPYIKFDTNVNGKVKERIKITRLEGGCAMDDVSGFDGPKIGRDGDLGRLGLQAAMSRT
jgi:hypothetical protein